mgnify:CR=1 FL=1
MLSYQEMLAVVDRHSKVDADGMWYPNLVKIRDELTYQWALDELQVSRVIFDMRDRGLV